LTELLKQDTFCVLARVR